MEVAAQQNTLCPAKPFCPATTFYGSVTLPFVIPSACDSFDLFLFSAYQLYFKRPQTRHPERSASPIYRKQRALSAESKDPGDACWQMLLGVFRLQTTPVDLERSVPRKSRSSSYFSSNRRPFLVIPSEAERPAVPRTLHGNVFQF